MLSKRNRSRWRAPKVSITSTTVEFLEAMKETYGGHISVHTHRESNPNWNPAWVWKIDSDACLAMLAEVEPFLLEPKKKARARHLRIWYKNLTPRNGKYTDHMIQLKQEFEDAFFNL